MPYAKVTPDGTDWYIQTSATVGLQAPLTSINKERLVSAAFSLGQSICRSSKDAYAWVDFSRWTPDPTYGIEQHTDETFQLAFTRFGVAVVRNWSDIFAPSLRAEVQRPVLIYNYDSYCYFFCDADQFIPEAQAGRFLRTYSAFPRRPLPSLRPMASLLIFTNTWRSTTRARVPMESPFGRCSTIDVLAIEPRRRAHKKRALARRNKSPQNLAVRF